VKTTKLETPMATASDAVIAPERADGVDIGAGATVTSLYRALVQAGDRDRANRLRQLVDQWASGLRVVAWIGAFSAGKSSLINALIGARHLPTGPLPTSANAVWIQRGHAAATARLIDGRVRSLSAPATWQEIEQWCRDGDTVEEVRLCADSPLLTGGLTLVDTPGVDSTDARHAAHTAAVIGLADVCAFVSDYNHVLSASNLTFLRSLCDHQKSVLLIVNQIDKHDPQEMSLQAFRVSLERALDEWRIEVARLYFVSAVAPGCEGDELTTLRDQLDRHVTAACTPSARHTALHTLVAEHGVWLAARQGAQAPDDADAAARHQAAIAALEQLEADIAARASQICDEMEQIIRQAIIMPYAATERLVAFIEARAEHFHIGMFSSAKRVQRERERRLQDLTEDLQQRVGTGIAEHLQQVIRTLQRDDGILLGSDSPLSGLAQGFGGAAFILGQIPQGAAPTREFAYAFARRLEESIRDVYRVRVGQIKAQIVAALAAMSADARSRLESEVEQTQAAWERACRAQTAEEERRAWVAQLEAMAARVDVANPVGLQRDLSRDLSSEGTAQVPATTPSNRSSVLPDVDNEADPVPAVPSSADGAQDRGAVVPVSSTRSEDNREHATDAPASAAVLAQLRLAADLCDTPTLARHRLTLLDRARRIEQRRYTIAVFGAFSAGKSSLINALVDSPLLPVSPNPTTATINRVLPPAPDHPDKSAQITVKSRERIEQEIMRAQDRLGLARTTIGDLPAALARLDLTQLPTEGRPLASYLSGIAAGYPLMADRLGQTLELDYAELGDFVVAEERAAFAERVDVYAASALADAGVILVDTPGADSLHARHADVAFRYLRDADTVLFATYYHHAFTKTDRELLAQMASVNDALGADTMLFVVTAADLAQSQAELAEVRAYVEEQLVRQGLRQPRIHTVSSLLARRAADTADAAARERLRAQAQVDHLRERLVAQTKGRLERAAAKAAQAELARIKRVLEQQLEFSRADSDKRAERLQAAQAVVRDIAQAARQPVELEHELLSAEIRELLHHVADRVGFSHVRRVSTAFHPAVVAQGTSSELERALTAWCDDLAADVQREVRATGIRVGKFAHELALAREQKLSKLRDPHLIAAWSAWEAPPTVDELPPDVTFIAPEQALREARRAWHSAQQFYEGEGRHDLATALEAISQSLVQGYLEQAATFFTDRYGAWLESALTVLAEHVTRELAQAVQDEERAADDSAHVDTIVERLRKWPR